MISKDGAYKTIEELVTRFAEQYGSYKLSDYNETLTRRDFIDPFFKALGWDIDNSKGNAEAYREVIHEERVKVGKATKAPDYTFRLEGGKRLFFVEAKKPGIDIKDDVSVAYQIRRYGWSARLPVSIITDFEEFAVYDCSKKPKPSDKASVARIKYLHFTQYLKEFDYLWDTFSKEKVLKGSFDRYVQSDTAKKGTATVDREFLASLDNWRTYLATGFSLRNKHLNEDEISYVVQLTIDRLIFLRIAEDREVEPYGQLKNAVTRKGESYLNLFEVFRKADAKYNSGLFDFRKDLISETLQIDNKVIKTLVSEMYYPESPYEFSVIPVEILGSAYEQFLGKQIRIDKAHRAKIELKPEVRKAGGVYYTPQFIVDYIVKNTVGKLIEGKTPKQIESVKILDPACGSGSFLLGAYEYLLNYHKAYYTSKGVKTGKRESPLTPSGELTSAEKKRILLNNIFGVDIDVNAVEVTKLSLLLKCMEGETSTTIAQQQHLWHERILPTLDENIKSGNSLVDVDFYAGYLNFGEEKKVKPFNWQKGFPQIFQRKKSEINPDFRDQYNKVEKLEKETQELIDKYLLKEPDSIYSQFNGFDVVIGNPPYGALFLDEELEYLRNRYISAVWRGESYLMFIERGLKLLNENGYLGLIIPDTLLNLDFTQPTRELILRFSKIDEVVGLPTRVFPGTTVDTIILITKKARYTTPFISSIVNVKTFDKNQVIKEIVAPTSNFNIDTKIWYEQNAFNLQIDDVAQTILKKIESVPARLGQISQIYSGIKTYEVGKGKPAQTEKTRITKPYTSNTKLGEEWLPFFDGKHIGRYELLWNKNNWINYGEWLAAPRNKENFEGEKILIRKITGKTLIANYVNYTSYCNTLLFVLKLNNPDVYSYKTILAILNSTLVGWYFRKKFQICETDTFPQIMIRDIYQIPIPNVNSNMKTYLERLVDELMKLNSDLKSMKLDHIKQQITAKI